MLAFIHRLVLSLGLGDLKMIKEASFGRLSLHHDLAGCVGSATCNCAVSLSVINPDFFILVGETAAGFCDFLPAESGHRVTADILTEDFVAQSSAVSVTPEIKSGVSSVQFPAG